VAADISGAAGNQYFGHIITPTSCYSAKASFAARAHLFFLKYGAD
jgi:hypothetical protein